ncbi:hypothetical protein BRADI_1g51732v3 [Brachypodium distachyon]|uniref:Uncharacterized protein n=1 Tax=Brachypodium distachyon TaxID=15368 RepID=A0A2K2DQZ2_BRADI|nr:hypothetical protein BRADI_1g51732v3 [Brachypodium distachyon]
MDVHSLYFIKMEYPFYYGRCNMKMMANRGNTMHSTEPSPFDVCKEGVELASRILKHGSEKEKNDEMTCEVRVQKTSRGIPLSNESLRPSRCMSLSPSVCLDGSVAWARASGNGNARSSKRQQQRPAADRDDLTTEGVEWEEVVLLPPSGRLRCLRRRGGGHPSTRVPGSPTTPGQTTAAARFSIEPHMLPPRPQPRRQLQEAAPSKQRPSHGITIYNTITSYLLKCFLSDAPYSHLSVSLTVVEAREEGAELTSVILKYGQNIHQLSCIN